MDACINLRYPLGGETSGIAIRLMGIGKPVLVTDGEEYARFPEDACLRIAGGRRGTGVADGTYVLLTSMRRRGAVRSASGRGAYRRHHAWSRSSGVLESLEECAYLVTSVWQVALPLQIRPLCKL